MKDKSKYYLDLSKCSEGEIKEVGRLLIESGEPIYEDTIQVFTNLKHNPNNPYLVWEDCEHEWMDVIGVGGLTEISFTAFKEMLGSGEGENNGWIEVTESLPNALQTVFISNGKGFTTIGCLAETEDGWHWAESNGVIYEANGEIISECESDDIEVNFWHPLPKPPKF